MTWLKAKCFSKGETLTKAKHHLFLINYQNGIWFFSKQSTSTVLFLYLLISNKKVSLPLSRNPVIWKMFCRKQAEQHCRVPADGRAHCHLPNDLSSPGWARCKSGNKKHSMCLTKSFSSFAPRPSLWQLCEKWGQVAQRPLPIMRRGCQALTSQLCGCSSSKYRAKPHEPAICICPRWINSDKRCQKIHA